MTFPTLVHIFVALIKTIGTHRDSVVPNLELGIPADTLIILSTADETLHILQPFTHLHFVAFFTKVCHSEILVSLRGFSKYHPQFLVNFTQKPRLC